MTFKRNINEHFKHGNISPGPAAAACLAEWPGARARRRRRRPGEGGVHGARAAHGAGRGARRAALRGHHPPPLPGQEAASTHVR